MGQAQEIAAQFLDNGVVGVVIGLGEGRGQAVLVLVHGNAAQRIGLAVEEEALLGVYAEIAETHLCLGVVSGDIGRERIEIGIQGAVPEMRFRQGEGPQGFAFGRDGAFGLQDRGAALIQQLPFDHTLAADHFYTGFSCRLGV